MRNSFLAGAALAALAFNPASAADALDEIIILNDRLDQADLAGSGILIGPESLQEHQYADIDRILRAAPGVYIQEEDGFGLRPNIGLRGTGLDRASKITLMEDGILVAPAPYAAPSAYYFPRAARMNAIEIVKGPAAIKYGPRTQGGSINLLTTPVPETASAQALLQYGEHDTARAHLWAGGPIASGDKFKLSGLIEGLHDESGGFKKLDGGGDTGYRFDDIVAKAVLETRLGELSFKIQNSDEISDETYLGLTEADFLSSPNRRYAASELDEMDTEHNLVSLGWSREFGAAWSVALIGYRTDFQRDWFKLDRVDADGSAANGGKSGASISSILADPAQYEAELAILRGGEGFSSADGALLIKHNNRDYYAQGLQGVINWTGTVGGLNNELELGFRAHEDEMDRFQWWERARIDGFDLTVTGEDTPGTESNRIDSAEALAFYIQDRIDFGRLAVTPGVRYEHIELNRIDYGGGDPDRAGVPAKDVSNTVEAFVPGVSAIFDVSPEWKLFAGVHRGFAPPAPGQTNVDEEKAWNWETGARWAGGASRAEAVFFYNDYENLLGSCTASTGGGCDIGQQFEGGEAIVKGLEFLGETDLAVRFDTAFRLPLRISYTWTEAEFDSSFASEYDPWGDVLAGDSLPYIPEHQAQISLGLETGRWGGNVNFSLIGERRAQAGQGGIPSDQFLDAHTLTDIAAWFALTERVQLRGSVRNLFDEEYIAARRPSGLRPGAPQTWLVGLNARF